MIRRCFLEQLELYNVSWHTKKGRKGKEGETKGEKKGGERRQEINFFLTNKKKKERKK